MTLKGSNFTTRNDTTRNHNPEGVEFQRNNIQKTNPIFACEEPTATH